MTRSNEEPTTIFLPAPRDSVVWALGLASWLLTYFLIAFRVVG